MRRLWIGFIPFALVSAVHVAALAVGADALAGPTKLALMPLLVGAVLWGAWGRWTPAHALLLIALGLSWLGDGAGMFFPWAPTVPFMLLFFGLAHLCYIWMFWRMLAVRPLPAWSLVFALWWGVLLAVLWPNLGVLLIPTAIYGLVLGGTAAAASRCNPIIVSGGILFLASDSILAFRLFAADAMPDWTSPLVMFTYTIGQGLLAAGVLIAAQKTAIAIEKVGVT